MSTHSNRPGKPRKRIVLVGVGRMGKNHLRVIRESAHFELAGVVDRDAPDVDYGAPRFREIAELAAKNVSFECGLVATPTATHFDVAKSLLEMDKHLLVEKPITSRVDRGRELIGLAQSRGLKLAVGHVERFNPAVRKLREVIKSGILGKAIHFSVTRVGGYPETLVSGNNVLLDLAVHDIDVLRSMIGPLKMKAAVSHSNVRDDVLDTAEILLQGERGPSATIHVNWITPTKIRTIRVTGTQGVCFVDYILQTCELLGGSLLKAKQPESLPYDQHLDLYKTTDRISFGVTKVEPLRAQLDQFSTWLDGGDPGELCLGRDALAAVLLAERAVNSNAKSQDAPPRSTNSSQRAESELPADTDEWV